MTHIYTDGACLLNTQGDLAIGLCGFYNQTSNTFVIDDQLSFDTTSYIMELKALALALKYIKSDAIIYCDSMQVIDNIATKGKKPKTEIERQIRRLFEHKNKTHNINMQWVKSHSDNVGNNMIDQKLEQEIVQLIQAMQPKYRDMIVNRVQIRYEAKGAFESFSVEFFQRLLNINNSTKIIDLKNIFTNQQFHKYIKMTFNLPEYYGINWNAFVDSFGDILILDDSINIINYDPNSEIFKNLIESLDTLKNVRKYKFKYTKIN